MPPPPHPIGLSDDIIVVTGGRNTGELGTQYHLTGGAGTPLAPQYSHACGAYQDADDQQVSCKGFAAVKCYIVWC